MNEAKDLTAALGGHWHGQYGTAPCPVCQSAQRKDQSALTLSDGHRGLLLHCKKSGCRFTDVLRAAGVSGRPHRDTRLRPAVERADRSARTSGHAERLWQASTPIQGTPADVYLRHVRKIDGHLPGTLRYSLCTWHGPSRQNLPALIARVDGSGAFAVSRTYLRADGSGKADLPGQAVKMMLGPAAGGHVALQTGAGSLVVAEGIETALSLPHLFDIGAATLWAALTSANLRSLKLPPAPGHLVVASDGDSAGRSAGDALAERATRLGWQVEIRAAPEAQDWNDVLMARAGGFHGV